MSSTPASADSIVHRPALVLGNGPSARLLDFGRLGARGFASVGMNAAYRHWDRIDFRPTYYICMDTVVIRSHAKRIAELIDEGRIERFFLRNEFLQDHPRFAEHPRITWFDEQRAAKNSLFDTDWVTTGSWAIRWMAHLGHPLVLTIGIDSNYVELLAEAKRLGDGNDLRLELTRAPAFNPNYFFADYQQAGDRYNIPNDPAYLEHTGGLVHIDALRQTRIDLERLELPANVLDCSPLSRHGVFAKMDLDRLLSAQQLGLVTSFFAAAPADEVINNINIALANGNNPDIGRVLVLFEGGREALRGKLSVDLMRQVEQAERSGRLQFRHIETRPDYLELFEAVRGLGFEVCAAANADVLLGPSFTSSFLAEYQFSERAFIALTRWNQTPRGLFIQGQAAHPPWQEVAVEQLTYRQVNHLSFDAYVFDRRTPLPPQLRQVLIGTFGCDTTIAALMRAAGQMVSNPCLHHRIVHVDEKIRNYSSEMGTAQMLANTEAVRLALLARLPDTGGLASSIASVGALRPAQASIGTPMHRLGRWHSILRMIGASPWVHRIADGHIEWEKISITKQDVAERPASVIERLEAGMAAHRFLEIEVHGQNGEHFLTCFGWTPELNETREKLFRYDRQSVIWVDMATQEERRVHADLLLVVRQCLTMGTGALGRAPGSGSLPTTPRPDAETGPVEPDPALSAAAALADPVAQLVARPRQAAAQAARQRERLPRLLLIDPTTVGHACATGQVKSQFLGDWPTDRLLQVWEQQDAADGGLGLFDFGRTGSHETPWAEAALLAKCAIFAPDVIYVRPVDSVLLLEFAHRALTRLRRPVVVHVMDDWPERARRSMPPQQHARLDALLHRLLRRAAARLSISEPMSHAYRARYGGHWHALANGVDIRQFRAKAWAARPPVSAADPFVLRYMGGLAADMGAASVADIARVVGSLQASHAVRLEVYTMPWYEAEAQASLGKIPGVSVHGLVAPAHYAATLAGADALVIAYNFDDTSLAYCGLSMANKLPECLAAGVPVLAYGPARSATIGLLLLEGCAEVVTERSEGPLRAALLRLMDQPGHAQALGAAGRAWVAANRSLQALQLDFASAITSAAAAPPVASGAGTLVVLRDRELQLLGTDCEASRWSARVRLSPRAHGFRLVVLVEGHGRAAVTGQLQVRWVTGGSGETGESTTAQVTTTPDGAAWMLLEMPVDGDGGELMIELRGDDAGWALDAAVLALLDSGSPTGPRDPGVLMHTANRLYREGALGDALGAYLDMLADSPLPMVALNAMRCAREMAGGRPTLASQATRPTTLR